MTYREYLIWTASHTACALNQAIRTAMEMEDENYAIQHLERTLDLTPRLALYHNPNAERVEPRPKEK